MDSDGGSDLTDLESDDYTETVKQTKSKIKTGYKIRNALKVPRATTYTAQALYEQLVSGDINPDPEYQRAVVWGEAKMVGLVDSIFRNFYIPPIIFAVHSSEDGADIKTCIDGKQRLTSIQKFMDGDIPHKDPYTGDKLWFKAGTETPKTRVKFLPEKYRKLFANKQIVCVEYQDITDADEREIFQRVQMGMALTPAEKLQVTSSPRATFVRELQAKHFKDDGGLAGDVIIWEQNRGSDFRGIAQSLYCMDKYTSSLVLNPTMPQLEKWLDDDVQVPTELKNRAHDTYRVFAAIATDKKLSQPLKHPAKISPIEFMSISLLIAVHKDETTLAQLSSLIGKMRNHVRGLHVDIRLNTRVMKDFMDFVKSAESEKIPGDKSGMAGSGTTAESLKRKRGDDDETPVKTKKAVAPKSTARPSKVTDRLAAIRSAKKSLPPPPLPPAFPPSLQAQLPHSPLSMSPTPVSHPPPSASPAQPGPSMSFPDKQHSSYVHYQQQNQQQILTSNHHTETSLMSAMERSHDPHPQFRPDKSLPPPPTSGGSASARYPENLHGSPRHSGERSRYPDHERDRDWDRDRDRDRDRGRDRDRDRQRQPSASNPYIPRKLSDTGWPRR